MTSSADLRRDDDGAGADVDDQTIQKPPDTDAAIEADAARGPVSAPRPAAGALSPVPADKLPPPPAHPLRPRLPSSTNAAGPASSPTGQMTPAMRAGAPPSSASALARAQPVKNEPANSDSRSDVRAVQSTRGGGTDARDAGDAGDDGDADGPRTLESNPPPSEPATSPKSPGIIAASVAPQTPKMPSAPRPASTAKGPLPPTSVKAPAVPPSAKFPHSAQGQVEIRTLDDDDSAEETEVKTLSADLGELVRNAHGDASEANIADDSVTAAAPEDRTAAVIRIGGKSLMPKTSSSANAEGAYDPDEEDSVTARSLAVAGADHLDDSITSQAPTLVGSLPEPVDETEGTTKRVRKKPKAAGSNATEAYEPDDSVTAAAPGHLTNMLRVIASPSETDAAGDEDEEAADAEEDQAHTQVMLNAPVKPPEPSRGRAIPDAPSSESGLRATGHDHRMAERASLGALGVAQHHSGAMRGAMTSDPALGASGEGLISRAPFAPMPLPQDDKRPPYALVVGIVAAISIVIPVLLFIILSQGGADADAPRVTSQPSPDPVGFTGPRPRAGKPASTTTPSPRPTPTAGGPTNRGPFRR